MKKYIKNFILISLFVHTSTVQAVSENDRHIYIGAKYGVSDPIVKSFRHKESNTLITLKKSHIYGGKVGYSFYPGMMVEISAAHQPKHRMNYKLPAQSLSAIMPGLEIPETQGTTQVVADVFTLNLAYEMEKMTPLSIRPYAIFGTGLAKIGIKPTISYWKMPAILGGNNLAFFRIKKTSQNCLAWHAGLGFNRALTDNFDIDLAAKMQVVNGIRIKYQTLNMATNSFDSGTKSIKKTIGVGEFTIGLTYKFALNRSKLSV